MTSTAVIKKGYAVMSKAEGRKNHVTHYRIKSRDRTSLNNRSSQHAKRSPEHNTGYPLNYEEIQAVKELFYENPSIQIGAEWFKSLLFKTPFSVSFGSSESNVFYSLKDTVQQKIINQYWMPWLFELYDRLKMYGIAPYYYKKIIMPNTNPKRNRKHKIDDDDDDDDDEFYHLIPMIPPIDSGDIYTYMNGREQAFYWKWNSMVTDQNITGTEDGSIYFIIRNSPSIFGQLTSPLKALVKDNVYIELIQLLTYRLGESLANPLHVIEFQPNLKDASSIAGAQGMRNPRDRDPVTDPGQSAGYPRVAVAPGSTNLEYISNYRDAQSLGSRGRTPFSDLGISDNVSNRLMGMAHYSETMERFNSGKGYGLESDTESSVSKRFNALKSIKQVRSGSPDIDDSAPIEDRLAYSRMSNTMLLEPYEKYVSGSNPSSYNFELRYFIDRFDKISAAVMDFPLASLVREMSNKTSNSSINLLEVKIKAETSYYSNVIKEVFSIAYLPLLHDSLSTKDVDKITFEDIASTDVDTQPERKEKFISAIHNSEISIAFPRIPNRSFEEFAILFQHRMISDKDFYQYGRDTIGIPGLDEKPTPEFLNMVRKLYPIPVDEVEQQSSQPNKKRKPNNNNEKTSKTKNQKVTLSQTVKELPLVQDEDNEPFNEDQNALGLQKEHSNNILNFADIEQQ